MKHPNFIKPEMMKKQGGGKISIVSYDLLIGDKVFVGLDAENRKVYKGVSEIHETRPHAANFQTMNARITTS